jgi:hypothetical protein
MNWQDLKVSKDQTRFVHNGKALFGKTFIEVLNFHSPGLAAVRDQSGAYHIDNFGNQLYSERYTRTFGYYCLRAAVVIKGRSSHLNERGQRVYTNDYSWVGNYQEDKCSVRDNDGNYFHIDLDGNKIYSAYYSYVGDYKDNISCVKSQNGMYRHINVDGSFLNNKEFIFLGVYHKNYATAMDLNGWYHIDKNGDEIYSDRFKVVEPFYNGFALVTQFDNIQMIIDEQGRKILDV